MSTETRPPTESAQASFIEPVKAVAAYSESLPVVPPECYPRVDDLVTEDDAPVDNMFSEKQQRLLTESLYTSWKPKRPFLATANVGLFFTPSEPPLVPDVLLSLDSKAPADFRPKENRSYFVWEFGKPPSLVIEIVSNKVGGEDTIKLTGYARLGIAFYVIFDPFLLLSETPLRVYRLNGASYEPMPSDSQARFFFPGLDLGVRCWQGDYEGCDTTWLRWLESAGGLVHTGAESLKIEQQRADAQQQRAEILSEKLRQLGINPDA